MEEVIEYRGERGVHKSISRA